MSAVVVIDVAELQRLVREAVRTEVRSAQLDDTVLTLEECAKLLKVKSPRTVTSYVENDGLPGHQLGKDWRFYKSEVLEWLRTRGKKKA